MCYFFLLKSTSQDHHGQAGLCSGSSIHHARISPLYILHPTQIPSADSIRIKNKQVRQIRNGIYPFMPNHRVTISIAVAIANHIHRAKRFCIAPTQSGFCKRTNRRQSTLNGARCGHRTVLIKNCTQNAITVGYRYV